MNHMTQLKKMGEESRRVYEAYFSMSVFEQNLLGIVEKSILQS